MNTHTKSTHRSDNRFLTESLPTLLLKTAAPIVLTMAANGLFALVDAYYLGEYVSADALTGVTLVFPIYMILVAFSTMVSQGYSSVVSRLLGARRLGDVANAVAGAVSLTLLTSFILIILYALFGQSLALWTANENQTLAQLGHRYLLILMWFCPLTFVYGIGLATFRCEGRIKAMSAVTILSIALNFVFNYLFIVQFAWGVEGSAIGTILSQFIALLMLIWIRRQSDSRVQFRFNNMMAGTRHWPEFLALGVPSSLGYVGISLSAAATLFNLQRWGVEHYAATAGAYGIVTRLMTFTYLPILGLSMAFQTIAGNNFGANKFARTTASLRLVLVLSLIYCATIQWAFYLFRQSIGAIFVQDTMIVSEIARILPIMTALLILFGPLHMVGIYFQAIGDAKRAAILMLARTYLIFLPLLFAMPYFLGEPGIWFAGPAAEFSQLIFTLGVLFHLRQQNQAKAVTNEPAS